MPVTNQLPTPTTALAYQPGVVFSADTNIVSKGFLDAAFTAIKPTREDISGQVNGITNSFTLGADYAEGSLVVFHDGIKIPDSEITETGTDSFDLDNVPTGSLIVRYRPLGFTDLGEVLGVQTRLVDGHTKLAKALCDNAVILVDTSAAAVIITLPDMETGDDGLRVVFVNLGGNTLTLQKGDDETIETATSLVLAAGVSTELIFVATGQDWVRIFTYEEVTIDVTLQQYWRPTEDTTQANSSGHSAATEGLLHSPFVAVTESPPTNSTGQSAADVGLVQTPFVATTDDIREIILED